MKGAARRQAREADANTMQSYQVLHFYGLAMTRKLKPLSHYLIDKPRRKRQSAEQMLMAMREFAARGASMNIRQIN